MTDTWFKSFCCLQVLACPIDPLTELMKVVRTGLLSNILQRPNWDRVGLGNRHRPNFAGVLIFVPERRVASLPTDRHESVFGERRENLVGGKRRSDHATLLKPWGRAFAPDLDVDPPLGEVCLGVVDFVAGAEVTI